MLSPEISIDSGTDKVSHIISWFEGTESPILRPEDIQEIRILSDSISFWYNHKLCNCPLRKREMADDILLVPIESFGVETLKMRVRTNIKRLIIHQIESLELADAALSASV